MNAEIADSVFNQLFLHQRNATEYFRLVQSDAPYYQLWEVTGDSLPGSGN